VDPFVIKFKDNEEIRSGNDAMNEKIHINWISSLYWLRFVGDVDTIIWTFENRATKYKI
jgi:hypothetical protein